MKAKEYLTQICDDTHTPSIQARIYKVLSLMVDEMRNIESIRHIKKDESKFSLLKEFDNKWKVIVNLAHRSTSIDIDIPDDEFQLYVYNNVPEFKKFIRIENPKNDNIKEMEEKIPYFHEVMPLNEITDKNIAHELLACMYAVGEYTNMGMPLMTIAPLFQRISLLRYWRENGIEYEQIHEFEKDREKFIGEVIKPMM